MNALVLALLIAKTQNPTPPHQVEALQQAGGGLTRLTEKTP